MIKQIAALRAIWGLFKEVDKLNTGGLAMLDRVKGYKTYITVVLAVACEGIQAVFPEYTGLIDSAQTVLAFIGLGFARAGMKAK